jgi:hypothetical protein
VHPCHTSKESDWGCALGIDIRVPLDSQVIRFMLEVAQSESKTKEILQGDATSFRR